MKDDDFFETPFFNSDGTEKLLYDSPPWHKEELFTMSETVKSTLWSEKSPEDIVNDLKSAMDNLSINVPMRIVVLGHSDVGRKGAARKIVDILNTNGSIEASFQEVDDSFKIRKDEVILFKPTEIGLPDFVQEEKPTEIGLPDFVQEEKPTIKPRNFNDRPSIPSKKRKWRK